MGRLGVLVSITLVACGFRVPTHGVDAGVDDGGTTELDAADAAVLPAVLYGHDETRLIALAPGTLDATTVTLTLPAGGPASLEELAVDSAGVIVGQSNTFDELYEIDPTTGICTPIAKLSTGMTIAFRGMAFVPPGAASGAGERLLARGTTGRLYDVDRATGQVTEIGPYTGDLGTRGDIVWLPGVGLLASVDITNQTGDALALVDPETATATLFATGDTTVRYIYGLAVADGRLVALVASGDVVPLSATTGLPTGPATTLPLTITWSGGGARLSF